MPGTAGGPPPSERAVALASEHPGYVVTITCAQCSAVASRRVGANATADLSIRHPRCPGVIE